MERALPEVMMKRNAHEQRAVEQSALMWAEPEAAVVPDRHCVGQEAVTFHAEARRAGRRRKRNGQTRQTRSRATLSDAERRRAKQN
jgi:hypothetical protein